MDTLQEHNNEVQDNLMKLWDEKKETLGLGNYSDEISLHIKNQNKSLLKKIAKGEIARIEKSLRKEDVVNYWQQVLQDLER